MRATFAIGAADKKSTRHVAARLHVPHEDHNITTNTCNSKDRRLIKGHRYERLFVRLVVAIWSYVEGDLYAVKSTDERPYKPSWTYKAL